MHQGNILIFKFEINLYWNMESKLLIFIYFLLFIKLQAKNEWLNYHLVQKRRLLESLEHDLLVNLCEMNSLIDTQFLYMYIVHCAYFSLLLVDNNDANQFQLIVTHNFEISWFKSLLNMKNFQFSSDYLSNISFK